MNTVSEKLQLPGGSLLGTTDLTNQIAAIRNQSDRRKEVTPYPAKRYIKFFMGPQPHKPKVHSSKKNKSKRVLA